MQIDLFPRLVYQCPVCENPYYNSVYCSGNSFGAIYYTDGSVDAPGLHPSSAFTQCPQCMTFLEKKHLLPIQRCPDRVRGVSPFDALKNAPPNAGHLDDTFRSNEERIAFLTKAQKQGLYSPAEASTERKQWHKAIAEKQLLRELWHCYNRDPARCEGDDYRSICKQYIALLNQRIDEERISLAELYRNIGCFSESESLLDGFFSPEKYAVYIDCIRTELKNKNTRTAPLPLKRR